MHNLLGHVDNPQDLRQLSIDKLSDFAKQLREETINIVQQTGGHLGAGLGVVELTVALHWAFNTPIDKLIWDIGHQAYPHKILTGRKNLMHTLRKKDGISGFLRRTESVYDHFGAGHSSTSLSAALGMAIARDLKGEKHDIVAVIGDGAIESGMAYEALQHIASLKTRMIVTLNDNKMSISPASGAMSKYLSKLISSRPYLNIRDLAKKTINGLPSSLEHIMKKAENMAKNLSFPANIFEDLGFFYIGPVDGHDVNLLAQIFTNIKNDTTLTKPILIHVITEKGFGYAADYDCAEKFHSISKINSQEKTEKKQLTYSSIFGEFLSQEASLDNKIIAVTAAMTGGTGLSEMQRKLPKQVFDVGIAEQHAVTFAAGLACENFKPVVAIYSTFLQRAYDQIIHDVSVQNLPVRFVIDRAGFVGSDGATHAGSFDITYLTALPNFILICPSDEIELLRALKTVLSIDHSPSAFRFPKDNIRGLDMPGVITPFPLGKGRVLFNTFDDPNLHKYKKILIISLGVLSYTALEAASRCDYKPVSLAVIDARFAKPIDAELILKYAAQADIILTIEEGAGHGFFSQVMKLVAENHLFTGKEYHSLCMPDEYVEHMTREEMLTQAKLDSSSIYEKIMNLVK